MLQQVATPDRSERLQRSVGTGRIAFKRRGRATVLADLHQSGCLKLRLPKGGRTLAEAVLINTAGGLTDGDDFALDARWGEGTTAVLTTQACERIYRSRGGPASVSTTISASDGATALWLPQETILFSGGRLRRSMDVRLYGDARFLGLESVILGRTAMGETVHEGALSDVWTIARNGRLLFRDRIGIDGDLQARLARRAVGDGTAAFATVLHAGGESAHFCRTICPLLELDGLIGGCSDLGGVAIARVLAPDGRTLRRALVRLLDAAGAALNLGPGLPPRVWMM